MSGAAECFNWFRDENGAHPVAIGTIRCFKAPDGTPGTFERDGKTWIKAGENCGLMLGHIGTCVMYNAWEEEALP